MKKNLVNNAKLARLVVGTVVLLSISLWLVRAGSCASMSADSQFIQSCIDFCVKQRKIPSKNHCKLYCEGGLKKVRHTELGSVEIYVDDQLIVKTKHNRGAGKNDQRQNRHPKTHHQMNHPTKKHSRGEYEEESDLVAGKLTSINSASIVSPEYGSFTTSLVIKPQLAQLTKFPTLNLDLIKDLEVHSTVSNFDRNFYTTPSSFDELIAYQGELMQMLYKEASQVFQTPGVQYPEGTMIHMLPMPIPVSQEQLNNQEFMNSMFNVVPENQLEFTVSSPLTFSDAHKDFLLNVKTDNAQHNQGLTAEQSQTVANLESQAQQYMSDFMQLAVLCQNAYDLYLTQNDLRPISYTLDKFTPTNSDCVQSNEKLLLYQQKSKEVSDYLMNINPYNELYVALGKQTVNRPHWSYGKSDIEAFRNYHRNLDEHSQSSRSSMFSIPISVCKSFFRKQYFGDVESTDASLRASLSFTGLGWQEISVDPSSEWFNINTVSKYADYPQYTTKNYFDSKGLLSRMPIKALIAYKPKLKMRISSKMKQEFVQRSISSVSRPFEVGPFVFNRVDIHSVWGSSSDLQYEMELTCNLNDPQVFAIKTVPVVPSKFTGSQPVVPNPSPCPTRSILTTFTRVRDFSLLLTKPLTFQPRSVLSGVRRSIV